MFHELHAIMDLIAELEVLSWTQRDTFPHIFQILWPEFQKDSSFMAW